MRQDINKDDVPFWVQENKGIIVGIINLQNTYLIIIGYCNNAKGENKVGVDIAFKLLVVLYNYILSVYKYGLLSIINVVYIIVAARE